MSGWKQWGGHFSIKDTPQRTTTSPQQYTVIIVLCILQVIKRGCPLERCVCVYLDNTVSFMKTHKEPHLMPLEKLGNFSYRSGI